MTQTSSKRISTYKLESEYLGNFLKIFFGNFLGIPLEFFGNTSGIVWELFGNSLAADYQVKFQFSKSADHLSFPLLFTFSKSTDCLRRLFTFSKKDDFFYISKAADY